MTNKNIITVFHDGPLHITGSLELKNAEGGTVEKGEELYLCRCGHSNNKPFCDGQHKKVGFKDQGEFIKPPESIEEFVNEGDLEIKVQENGPLIFRGNACVKDSSGKEVNRKVGGLCRCGRTNNAPFCDGTHTKVDFIAE